MLRLMTAVVAVSLLMVQPAYAYVDPGSAMLLLQGILGAVAAAGMFFRRGLMALFVRSRKQTSSDIGSNGDRLTGKQ